MNQILKSGLTSTISSLISKINVIESNIKEVSISTNETIKDDIAKVFGKELQEIDLLAGLAVQLIDRLMERLVEDILVAVGTIKYWQLILDLILGIVVLLCLIFICYMYFQQVQKMANSSKEICSIIPLNILISFKNISDTIEKIIRSI